MLCDGQWLSLFPSPSTLVVICIKRVLPATLPLASVFSLIGIWFHVSVATFPSIWIALCDGRVGSAAISIKRSIWRLLVMLDELFNLISVYRGKGCCIVNRWNWFHSCINSIYGFTGQSFRKLCSQNEFSPLSAFFLDQYLIAIVTLSGPFHSFKGFPCIETLFVCFINVYISSWSQCFLSIFTYISSMQHHLVSNKHVAVKCWWAPHFLDRFGHASLEGNEKTLAGIPLLPYLPFPSLSVHLSIESN